MALIYELVWRVLHLLIHIQRALILWLRICLRTCKGRLLGRAVAALLMPIALAGFPEYHKKLAPTTGKRTGNRLSRWCTEGKSLEKVPQHVGLLIAEEEPSYTDVANLVVWCMAVGISYVSVYDNRGVFQKNNAILLEAIVRRQQEVLGPEGSKCNMEFTSNGIDKHQYQVLSCQSVVRVLSPEDGKQSIVQVAQQLCRAVEQKEKTFKDIDVSTIDTLLRDSKKFPDPELVLKFGQIDSTLGFLPWHIRLTEFISMPSHIDVSYEDLYGALQRYASCEQRLGK